MTIAEQIDALLVGEHDYNTSAEACVEAGLVAFNHAASRMGLTGFQASWAALTLYARILGYECPLIVFKGEDALYPQYDLPGQLEEWLSKMRPWLAERATELLAERHEYAYPDVVAHWNRLVSS